MDQTRTLRLSSYLYDITIDLQDITNVQRLQTPNEEATNSDEEIARKDYIYDYILQLEVSAINGLTVVETKSSEWSDSEKGAEVEPIEKGIKRRSSVVLSTIFFKVSTDLLTSLIDCPQRQDLEIAQNSQE